MNGMIGADVQQLRDLATAFRTKSVALNRIERDLQYRIHSAPWQGHDVQNFVHRWDTSHRKVLHNAAQSILMAANDLDRQAKEQEEASSAGGGGASGVLPSYGFPSIGAVQDSTGENSSFAGNIVSAIEWADSIKGLKVSQTFLSKVDGQVLKAASLSSKLITVGKLVEGGGKIGGKFLGPLGIVFGVGSLYGNIQEGNAREAIIDGVGLALSVAGTAVAFGVFGGPLATIVVGAGLAVGAIQIGMALGKVIGEADWQAVGAGAKVIAAPLIQGGKVLVEAAGTAKKIFDTALPGVSKTIEKVGSAVAEGAKQVGNFIKNPAKALFGW